MGRGEGGDRDDKDGGVRDDGRWSDGCGGMIG